MRSGTRRRTCGTVAASGINGERRNRNSRVAGPPYGLGERRKFDLAQRKTRSRRPATHVGAPGPSGQRRGLLCRVRGGRRRRRRAQCRLRRDLGIGGRRRRGVAGKAHHGPNNSGRVGSQSAPETRRHRNPRASLLARGLSVVVNTLYPDILVLGGGMANVDELYDDLPPRLAQETFSPCFYTPIVRAMHGDSSGVRGAAWLWR